MLKHVKPLLFIFIKLVLRSYESLSTKCTVIHSFSFNIYRIMTLCTYSTHSHTVGGDVHLQVGLQSADIRRQGAEKK